MLERRSSRLGAATIKQINRQTFPLWLTVLAGIVLIPISNLARIGLALNMQVPISILLGFALSIVCAAVLYQLGFGSSWIQLKRDWIRLIPAGILAIIVVIMLGFKVGISVAIIVLAAKEFQLRGGNWRNVLAALALWVYLLIGVLIALSYSTIIVVFRQCSKFDPFFGRLDSFLMFGHSVVQFSRACTFLYYPAEDLYFIMPGVLGAAILFLCLSGDKYMAFQMNGAILLAFFISLVISYFLPAIGPFITSGLPPGLISSSLQHTFLVNATMLYHHQGWVNPIHAYYPAFPSLHVAQPLIAWWWLRRWRMVSAIVGLYCVLLVPAILILQWHYFVDILAGIVLAGLAIAIVSAKGGKFETNSMRESAEEQTPSVQSALTYGAGRREGANDK
jgi:hypothetical protein